MEAGTLGKNRRKEKQGLPTLAPVPRREKSGRNQRTTTRAERDEVHKDAMLETLRTRCRHLGLPQTRENMNLVKSQHFEGQIGHLLFVVAARDEIGDFWRTFAEWDFVEERYSNRILGKPRHPKTSKIEMMPETLETRDDDPSQADTRTEDEKDRAAANAWMHWRGNLGKLGAADQSILHDGALGRCDLVSDGKPTMAGRSFFRALRRLHEVKE